MTRVTFHKFLSGERAVLVCPPPRFPGTRVIAGAAIPGLTVSSYLCHFLI